MASMINDLLNPKALPDLTDGVSLVQTHISFVIIGDKYVYKLKKAVDFGFLDFSTLEKRKYFCQQEVDLNRRFSQGLYIDVLPVFFNGKEHTMGKEDGRIVDYAVRMRRLSDNILMKSVFNRGELNDTHLKNIAQAVAGFHLQADTSPEIDKFGEPDKFKFTTDENFEQTEKYVGISIDKNDFEHIREWTNNFFMDKRDLFFDRIDGKKVRDCHGDLHMEHICLTDPVSMFDCIEFNDRLRYTDILADIGFLLMDLEYRGGMKYSDRLWKLYCEITGDCEMKELLDFYKVYRAYVRGKVNSFQIDDDNIDNKTKAEIIESARKYFKLAKNYIR